MNDVAADIRSVVVERDIPFAPEKIWRALTQPHLIAEWLMKNDFAPAVDHRFRFTADIAGAAQTFRGVLDAGTITGTVQKTAEKSASGSFTIKFVE